MLKLQNCLGNSIDWVTEDAFKESRESVLGTIAKGLWSNRVETAWEATLQQQMLFTRPEKAMRNPHHVVTTQPHKSTQTVERKRHQDLTANQAYPCLHEHQTICAIGIKSRYWTHC